MPHLRTLVLAAGLSNRIYAQVIAGDSSGATATATVVATTQVTDSSDSSDSSDDSNNSTDAINASVFAYAASAAPVAQVSAAASVVSIFFPGADPLPYVASVIGQNNGAQTLAISCGPGVDADTCGFPSSVTVTAGPSTAYVSVSNQEATFIYDCKISASTAAVCAETFQGDPAYIQTKSQKASAASTSTVVTETLGSTDITWMPITITAGGGQPMTNPMPKPTGSAGSSAVQPPPAGGNSWIGVGSLGGSGQGSGTATATATATGSASASQTGSGSGSGTNPSSGSNQGSGSASSSAGTGSAGNATGTGTSAVGTPTKSNPISTWTGAATRLGGYTNYAAAGLAIFAGLAL